MHQPVLAGCSPGCSLYHYSPILLIKVLLNSSRMFRVVLNVMQFASGVYKEYLFYAIAKCLTRGIETRRTSSHSTGIKDTKVHYVNKKIDFVSRLHCTWATCRITPGRNKYTSCLEEPVMCDALSWDWIGSRKLPVDSASSNTTLVTTQRTRSVVSTELVSTTA